MTKRHDVNQVRAFMDLLSDEIMSLSDDEILARAKEQGVDVDRNHRAFHALIKGHTEDLKFSRLREARKAMDGQVTKAASALKNLSFDDMKKRFAELIAAGLIDRDSQLSISFRSGKEIDQEDLRSALEDYEELKKQQDGK